MQANTHDKSKNAESPCFSAWDHGLSVGNHVYRRAGKHHDHTENGENDHRDSEPMKTPNRIKQASQTDITMKIVDLLSDGGLLFLTTTINLPGFRLFHASFTQR